MMFRRNSQQEDPDLMEARRRLQASMLVGEGGGGGGGGPNGLGGGSGADGSSQQAQQQQLQLLREQQIIRDARTAAGFGSGGLGLGGMSNQQQAQSQEQQLQQQLSSFSGGGLGGGGAGGGSGSGSASLPTLQQQLEQQQNQMGQMGPGQLNQQLLQQQQLELEQLQLQQQQLSSLSSSTGSAGGMASQLLSSSSGLGASSASGSTPGQGLVVGGGEGGGSNGDTTTSATSRRGSYASMLGEQRLAIQRAQMDIQRHAQAQAQAEARMKALLDHEAQVQDQVRLLTRQRQLDLGGAGSGGGAGGGTSAYDMLANGAGRSLEQRMAAATGGGSGTGDLSSSLDTSTFSAYQQHRASLLGGLQGAGGGAGSMNQAQQTNSVLPNSLRGEEAMVFGKINRETNNPGAVADVALLHQSRLTAEEKLLRSSVGGDNAKEAHPESGEDDEEEELNDEEYFKTQAGEPGADGGYPIAREAFPIKLYRILYEAEQNKQDDIISFFPHGRAFAVHKSKEFTRDIMPKYFPAGRMNTFLKQLNLYGFRRITEGRDKGGYFHKDFLKGKRFLCKKIKRKKVHVNKAPPPTPAHSHHHLQQSALQAQLPFLDPLGGLSNAGLGNLGNHSGRASTNHQLLQQQQMASLGLPSAGTAGASSLFPNNNSLLNPSSTDLTQAYIQDLPLQSAGSRLNPSNFNMNLNNFNPNNNFNGNPNLMR